MEHAFWHERWDSGRVAFHEGDANGLLVKHFKQAFDMPGARVFLPLCGKTRDIAWLLGQGYRVVGAELSETAVEQLFEDLGHAPSISSVGKLKRFAASGIDIFAGDIFKLDSATLGAVTVTYDRAALVALPEAMRRRYAAHLAAITGNAPQFLNTLDYDQNRMAGPPFAVDAAEVRACHGDRFEILEIDRIEVPGGLKGQCPATETVWRLESHGADRR